MRALHFTVAYRTQGTKKAPAQAHVRYITRAQASAAEHVDYVTRTTQQTREDLVASGYGNLPTWAHNDPAAFFAESDRWERANGRTATQMTAALPRALGRGELIATVESFIHSQLGKAHGYVWGIHETVASDGGRYPHVHIAFSERQDTGRVQTPQEYFSQRVNLKDRSFNSRQWPYAARQAWSDTLNVALEASGSPERVSARSFRDQGVGWQAAQYIDRQTLQRDKSLLRQRERAEDTPEALAKRAQEWETRKRQLGITRDMDREEIIQRIGDASRSRLNTSIAPQQRTRTWGSDQLDSMSHVNPRPPQNHQESEARTRGPVIGNKRSMIYHELHHKNYGDIHPNNQVHFRSAQDAEAAGFRRARNDHYGEGTGVAQKLEHVRQLRRAEEYYVSHPGILRPPAHLAAIAKVLHEDTQDHGRVRRRRRERDDEQERTRTHAREW
jgi:hypothetical protein